MLEGQEIGLWGAGMEGFGVLDARPDAEQFWAPGQRCPCCSTAEPSGLAGAGGVWVGAARWWRLGARGWGSLVWRRGRARPLLVLGAGFLENGLSLEPCATEHLWGGLCVPLVSPGMGS